MQSRRKYPPIHTSASSSLPPLSRLAEQTRAFLPRWTTSRRVDAESAGNPWQVHRWEDGQRIVAARFPSRWEAVGYMLQLNEEEHIRLILETLMKEADVVLYPYLNEIIKAPLCPPADTFKTSTKASHHDGNG